MAAVVEGAEPSFLSSSFLDREIKDTPEKPWLCSSAGFTQPWFYSPSSFLLLLALGPASFYISSSPAVPTPWVRACVCVCVGGVHERRSCRERAPWSASQNRTASV